MSDSFYTGLFTLFAALGAIWLKDYLDNKKIYRQSIRQKAIEAYTLCGSLPYSLNPQMLICKNLLNEPTYNYTNILESYPDTSSDDLKKLELIIIENFHQFKSKFLTINQIIIEEAGFLLNIIANPDKNETSMESFQKTNNNYTTAILKICTSLQDDLLENVINIKRPHPNIFRYIK